MKKNWYKILSDSYTEMKQLENAIYSDSDNEKNTENFYFSYNKNQTDENNFEVLQKLKGIFYIIFCYLF